MQIYRNVFHDETADFRKENEDFYVQTIGVFDGVHAGHRFLLGEVKKEAEKRGLKSMVITFNSPPAALLRPNDVPPLLTTTSQKLRLIEECGIDAVAMLDFTPQLANMSARNFMHDILCHRLNGKVLFIGYDHRFGHNSADTFEDYQRYGKEIGLDVLPAPEYTSPSGGHISSTAIRRLLMGGDVEEAARLLTRPYRVEGIVEHGDGIGRHMGFPTANIRPNDSHQLLLAAGAYAVKVTINSKKTGADSNVITTDTHHYAGMLYIGTRPTFANKNEQRMEVNILDFNGDIYGQILIVDFLQRLRGEQRFSSPQALEEQLLKDRESARRIATSQ